MQPLFTFLNPAGGWRNREFGELADLARKKLWGLDDQVLASLICYLAPLHVPDAERHSDPVFDSYAALRHVLLEGMNGTAKTQLAKGVNNALIGRQLRAFYDACSVRRDRLDSLVRTQGSPELAPTDIVGADSLAIEEAVNAKDAKNQVLRFIPGPILRNYIVFYADELNRSPPRTQSVLLEAMAENQVTINTQDPSRSRTEILRDFFLMASQNPEKHIGVFPLPEAQLDRFMIRVIMPFSSDLVRILELSETHHKDGTLSENLAGQAQAILDEFSTRLRGVKQFNRVKWIDKPPRLVSLFKLYRILAKPDGVQPEVPANVPKVCHRIQRMVTLRATPDFFVREIEHALINIRLRELRKLRRSVAENVKISASAYQRIAKIVYATWPREAAEQTIEGLDKVISESVRVQDVAKDFQSGSSIRGAQALRDFARALAWAKGDAEVIRDHVDYAAPWVLNHRVRLRNSHRQPWRTRDLIVRLVNEVD